jgi:hypothetical protein
MHKSEFQLILQSAWKELPSDVRMLLMSDQSNLRMWIAQMLVSEGIASSTEVALVAPDFDEVYKQFTGM